MLGSGFRCGDGGRFGVYRRFKSDFQGELGCETVQELGVRLPMWLPGLGPPGFPSSDLDPMYTERLSDFGLRQASGETQSGSLGRARKPNGAIQQGLD